MNAPVEGNPRANGAAQAEGLESYASEGSWSGGEMTVEEFEEEIMKDWMNDTCKGIQKESQKFLKLMSNKDEEDNYSALA